MKEFTVDQWILIATILAILVGPLVALHISGRVAVLREARDRKYRVLSNLMSTRAARLDALHISALNLVELEFYKCPKVRTAYKNYVESLRKIVPAGEDERNNFLEDQDDLFSSLLVEIASELGFKFDKSDLGRLGYLPQAHANLFDNQLLIAQNLRELLEGRRAIPITNFVSKDSAFPPPPE